MTHASSQKLQNLEIALRLVQRVDGLLTVEEALSGGNGHQLLLLEPMGRRQHDIGVLHPVPVKVYSATTYKSMFPTTSLMYSLVFTWLDTGLPAYT